MPGEAEMERAREIAGATMPAIRRLEAECTAAVMDNGIREVHGATRKAGSMKNPITLRERDQDMVLAEGFSDRFVLNAADARHLARKLNRIALRLERRVPATRNSDTTEVEG